jgi:hypothetical protein
LYLTNLWSSWISRIIWSLRWSISYIKSLSNAHMNCWVSFSPCRSQEEDLQDSPDWNISKPGESHSSCDHIGAQIKVMEDPTVLVQSYMLYLVLIKLFSPTQPVCNQFCVNFVGCSFKRSSIWTRDSWDRVLVPKW